MRARRLVDEGCNSVESLRDPRFLTLLPKAVQLSIKYYDFVSSQASRSDAELLKVLH